MNKLLSSAVRPQRPEDRHVPREQGPLRLSRHRQQARRQGEKGRGLCVQIDVQQGLAGSLGDISVRVEVGGTVGMPQGEVLKAQTTIGNHKRAIFLFRTMEMSNAVQPTAMI